MSGAVVVYVLYVALAIGLISWLAFVLQRDGKVFLDDVFAHQPDLAGSVSKLLVTGFLVFTLGYALLLLRVDNGASTQEALHSSVQQFGILLVSLGALHMLNMLIFLQVRRRNARREAQRAERPQRRALRG